jgi:FtsZ-binding cell division protein ZapB
MNDTKTLIEIPSHGKYIEILGYRIDGFESFDAFCEHLKKYAEMEDTISRQRAEIERLKCDNSNIHRLFSDACKRVDELDKLNETVKAEAIKEFAERLKEKKQWDVDIPDYVYVEDIDNLVKEMVGEG